MRAFFPVSIFSAVLISGCATAYDPVEVCSAQWIKPRAERAIGYLEQDTERVIKSLKKNAESFEKGKTPGPFQILSLTSAIDKLTKEFKSGRAIKDLRILRDTCNEPEIIEEALTSFMKDQGLPSGMIDFIRSLAPYQDLIQSEMNGA